MKYKNVTSGVLKFKAYNEKGEKVVYEVLSGGVVDTGAIPMKLGGMEEVKEEKKIKKRGEE